MVLDGVLCEGISGALWGPDQTERSCGDRSEVEAKKEEIEAVSEDNHFSDFH